MSIDLLKRYGKHDWDCLAGAVGGDCTCGFDAALKAAQSHIDPTKVGYLPPHLLPPQSAQPDRVSVPREPTAHAHLQALVTALDNAFISTWQSTAAWQKELDAANEYLLAAAQEGK